MRPWPAIFGVILLSCCLGAAPRARGRTTRPSYRLSFRPHAGQRIAWDQWIDARLNLHPAADRSTARSRAWQVHRQIDILRDEVTQLRQSDAVARRVSFGMRCWRMERYGADAPDPIRLVFANKTVNFRLDPDGTIQQDFGVQPTGPMLQLIKNSILGHDPWLPAKPVAIGQRWRADEGLRAMLDLGLDAEVSAIAKLARVRRESGRLVADIAMTGGALGAWHGFHAEISARGALVVDLRSGVLLKADLIGGIDLSPNPDMQGPITSPSAIVGSGRIEAHRAARFLPDRDQDNDSDTPTEIPSR